MLYSIIMGATQPAAGTAQGGGGNASFSILLMIGMFAVLYFLMIMPQQKKQKQLQKMLDSLQVNDKVITTSGIYGRVVSLKPDKNTVVIEIDETNKVRVEFQRGAIASIVPPASTTQS